MLPSSLYCRCGQRDIKRVTIKQRDQRRVNIFGFRDEAASEIQGQSTWQSCILLHEEGRGGVGVDRGVVKVGVRDDLSMRTMRNERVYLTNETAIDVDVL